MNLYAQDHIDLDAYLPEDTLAVCEHILGSQQDEPGDPPKQPQLSTCLFLPNRLQQYITRKETPAVGLLQASTGCLDHVQDHLAEYDIDLDTVLDQTDGEEGP